MKFQQSIPADTDLMVLGRLLRRQGANLLTVVKVPDAVNEAVMTYGADRRLDDDSVLGLCQSSRH